MGKLELIISRWGYWAVLLGTVFEGEVTLILGSFLASQQMLDIKAVTAIGALGGFIGDQLFFILGRLGRNFKFVRQLTARPNFQKAEKIVKRYGTYIICVSRYLIGMRMALSISLGIFGVSARKFAVLNLVSAVFWAVTVSALGYGLGKAALALLGNIKKYEWATIGATLAVTAAALYLKQKIKKAEEEKIS